jgi:hypothetical protein
MTRPPRPFKQQDLVRALKAAKVAGFPVDRVEIDADGKIIISAQRVSSESTNPYDAWKAKQNAV